MKDHVLLIDGNSIMNRAFFGIKELTNSEGLHTNAIYGFLNIFFKTLEEEGATHVVVAFDLKAPTFRHIKYEAYKGNRTGMQDELREQMPVIKQVLKEMNITISEIEGYEADDVLGTLAKESEKQNKQVTILSGDRDLLQLASDTIKISIPKTKSGMTTTEHYFSSDVVENYGVTPTEFIDVKGLMGDKSDNIPGVPGIGEKTATKLISEYHSIENVIEHINELPTKVGEKINDNISLALLSKELATICTDCETKVDLDSCLIKDMFNRDVYQTFKRLEFKSFLNRFETSTPSIDEKDIDIIIIEQSSDIKDFFDKENKIAYFLIEQDEHYYLSYAVNNNKIYYTDSSLIEAADICSNIAELLNNKNKVKITHNLKEQLHLLKLTLPTDNSSVYDLALVAYLLNPVKETYNIDDLANDFLQMAVPSFEELTGKGKQKKKIYDLTKEDIHSYMANGTYTLISSFPDMLKKLTDEELNELYFNIELPLLYVLKSMETLGVQVDAYMLKEYGGKLHSKILELEKIIYEHAHEEFNINSPKQLGEILFEKLKLPTVKKTKTGYSTAADVLEKLEDEHPIIKDILSYRQLAKLKSTYADGLFEYIGSDQRIHSSFNQKVTSTGRISSTEPNLQNIPVRIEIGREIRRVFVPKEGYVFIDADYSQIELRILAHLSEDETFIEAFNNNLDIHTITASQVFHVPFEEVTSLQRRNAKAVNFGIVYGISAFGLSRDLNISRKEATNYIEQYFNKYPKVKAFLDQTVINAKLQGYVRTMYNRLRYIPELSSSNFAVRSFGERVAMNTPIQGSAADIIKIAMINVYNRLKSEHLLSSLILTVHDELLIETHHDEIEQVKALLIEEMENAVKLKVPLTVDAHVGSNWYEAK